MVSRPINRASANVEAPTPPIFMVLLACPFHTPSTRQLALFPSRLCPLMRTVGTLFFLDCSQGYASSWLISLLTVILSPRAAEYVRPLLALWHYPAATCTRCGRVTRRLEEIMSDAGKRIAVRRCGRLRASNRPRRATPWEPSTR